MKDIYAPLVPRVVRCQLIENIPAGNAVLMPTDEQRTENIFTQAGAACRDLPSSVPQRLSHRARRFGAD